MQPLDMNEVRDVLLAELERRRVCDDVGSYSDHPGGDETLYAITGGVNVKGALGASLGSASERADVGRRIISYRNTTGWTDKQGEGHAFCAAVAALNLLGVPTPRDAKPLAPSDPKELEAWIDSLDWSDTHKDLWGGATPLLASGRASTEWLGTFRRNLAGRIDPARPLETWCRFDDKEWRVISCIYHVLSTYDAGRVPYPHPEILLARMLDLRWDEVRREVHSTACTDGDWAWVLLRLCEADPARMPQAIKAIRRVSAQRVEEWREGRVADWHGVRRPVTSFHTRGLHMFLWSTSVFQNCVRGDYVGAYVRDTLNDPALFRLE